MPGSALTPAMLAVLKAADVWEKVRDRWKTGDINYRETKMVSTHAQKHETEVALADAIRRWRAER